MKFMTTLLALMLISSPAWAQPQKADIESVAINVVMTHCIAPIFTGDDPARLARQQKLMEFPQGQAAKFLGSQPGSVFAIQAAPGNLVLKTLDNGVCQIMIRELNADKFRQAIDEIFTPGHTPWVLMDEKAENGSTTKIYATDQKGEIVAIIGVKNAPAPGDAQAVVTIARHK